VDSVAYQRGIELFNAGEFFAAHEVLEDVWRPAAGTERRFLQGLIQIAVALHHFTAGNRVGAQSLLARGAAKLDGLPDAYLGVRVDALRPQAEAWLRHLAGEAPQPPFPRL
jgi:predicted metal-dependent hydrolase